MALILPFVPTEITVHLGAPTDNTVQDVTLPFSEYIKNVASSELYPTWPESALRANIIAQVSFALNRIYNEFYPAQGYSFDITSLPQYDQTFVRNRGIFENISEITDQLFNTYIRREGFIEPLLAAYCDGVRTICNGLSQWGSVDLAEAGFGPFDILQNYYGNNIDLVYDAPLFVNLGSYPGTIIRQGDFGDNVRYIQQRLNAISVNYPFINKINPVNGVFDEETETAVRQFQQAFGLTVDGLVGKVTWYKLIQIYTAVRRLNEVDSLGLPIEGNALTFFRTMQLGNAGYDVQFLQYLINTVATYSDVVPYVEQNGFYGEDTEAAIRSFQISEGLPPTGIADPDTINTLFDVYSGDIASSLLTFGSPEPATYPGNPLRIGDSGQYVLLLQQYLTVIEQEISVIPPLVVTGIFSTTTQNAVSAFQRLFGLNPSGIVDRTTWDTIVTEYSYVRDELTRSNGQFPGYTLTQET